MRPQLGATRRDTLRRGLAAGAAATLAPALLARSAAAQETAGEDDPSVIEGALGIEQAAVVVYAETGRLFGPEAEIAGLFERQHREHVAALTKALEDLGGEIPEPPLPTDVPGLTEVKQRERALAFAVETENQCLAVFVDAASKLDSGDLLRAGAQIAANDGVHLVILRQVLDRNPVPSAYPSGSEKS